MGKSTTLKSIMGLVKTPHGAIELDGEEASFSVPPWLGPEVSADRRYSNGALSRNPYRRWNNAPKQA